MALSRLDFELLWPPIVIAVSRTKRKFTLYLIPRETVIGGRQYDSQSVPDGMRMMSVSNSGSYWTLWLAANCDDDGTSHLLLTLDTRCWEPMLAGNR